MRTSKKCSKCQKTPAKNGVLCHHKFPKPESNLLRARAWAKYCWPEQDWLCVDELIELHKTKVLCKNHFEDKCFTDSTKKYLGKFSIPGKNSYVIELMKTLKDEMHLMQPSKEAPQVKNLPKMLTHVPKIREERLEKYDYIIDWSLEPEQSLIEAVPSTTCEPHFMPILQQNEEASQVQEIPKTLELVPNTHKESLENYDYNIDSSFEPDQSLREVGPSFEPDQSLREVGPSFEPDQSLREVDPSAICDQPHGRNPVNQSNKFNKTKKTRRILKTLDVKQINELNPREKKLYNICVKNFKELSRMRKVMKYKKNTDILQSICENKHVKELHDMKLSKTFMVLLQSQLQNCKKKQKARRYNTDQKMMAVTLYKKSPACYRLLRRMFALPSQSTIKKMLNSMPLKAGMNPQVFEALKSMARKQVDDDNLCILSFDEMAIRKHLMYNQKLDIIEGYQDHGNHGRTMEIASNVLVFMLAGVLKKWKQPIAFYFSGKSVTADRLHVIIKEMLHECRKTGLNVVGTVCDLSRVNIKALDILGSSIEKPYFTHEGHEIVTILDPPHLLKCTRNLFLKYDVECSVNVQVDGRDIKGVAKWSHLLKFYEMEKNNPNHVFAPKLTEQHLHPNNQQKMRVKLAAQVFSNTVTSGILAKIATSELPAEANATAVFLKKFDQLFDALNADSPNLRDGKMCSTNMTMRSPHLNLFKQMRKFILDMKYIGSNSPPPSQVGWIRTMNAVERLWRNLNCRSLSTRRLNQDPLENCFGCIRYHCGSNVNPNVIQFIAGIKTGIINNLRHSGTRKNCEEDEAVLGDDLKEFLLSSCQTSQENVESASENFNIDLDRFNLDHIIADATETVDQATPEAQACAYVCGFIYKKLKHRGCSDCKNVFLETTLDNIHLFTSFKEYRDEQTSLNYVNRSFVHVFEICASGINQQLKKEAWKKDLKKNTMAALSQLAFGFLDFCPKHLSQNKAHILNAAFHICIKRFIVLRNRELGVEEKTKALERKMRILRNK